MGPLEAPPLPEALEAIIEGRLGYEEAKAVALGMLQGAYDDVGIAAILAALRAKGETPDVVAGFASALRETCVRVEPPRRPLLDTAGTGGDKSHTINASTAAAIAASALGAVVAKHGNRSVSSRSGSADFLEELGYRIDHGPEAARCMLEKVGFTFLYAPRYHPAVKRVMPVRRKLGIRTVFNLVGPLSNPARAERQVLGVAAWSLAGLMAEAAQRLGYERLLVVHGEPGIDEVSVTGQTRILIVEGGRVEEATVTPEELGVKRHPLHELRVETPQESAERVRRVFEGRGRHADHDFIAANTAAALYAAGIVKDLREGVELFNQAAAEARLAKHLEAIIEACRECCKA